MRVRRANKTLHWTARLWAVVFHSPSSFWLWCRIYGRCQSRCSAFGVVARERKEASHMSLKAIIEGNDTKAGRAFDVVIQLLIVISIITFSIETGRQLFQEGAYLFKEADLEKQPVYQSGKHSYIFSWMGDKVVNTLAVLLIRSGYVCSNFSGVIEVQNSNADDIKNCLIDIANDVLPDETELAETLSIQQKLIEKYDEYLPEELLTEGYGRKAFNSTAAKQWILGSLV